MKFARSSAALLLFVTIANCVPVATNTIASASITQFTFPTTVALANGNSVQSSCKSVQIVDLSTGAVVETVDCSPDNSGVNNDNASNSASTNTSDTGAIIIATGSSNASSTIIFSPSQTASSDANNSNSDGSANNTSTDPNFGLRDQGVDAEIIDRATLSASQINATTTGQSNDQSDAAREKGKRNVVMTNVKSTPDGPVSENCQIQLTPQANGEYTEMQTCELSIESNANVAPSPVPSSTPEAIVPSSATSDPVSETPLPASPSSSPQSSPASSDSVPTTPTSPVPVSSLSPSSDSASPTPETSSSAGDGSIVISTGLTSLSLPTASVSALGSLSSDSNSSSTNGTAAADTAAPFSVPGKHLSVLPVGLAVFAGVSGIALIVVGVVTYERTKYRKNFRRRQLAEQLKAGANQMSERSLV